MERATIADSTNEKELNETSMRSRFHLNQELSTCSPQLLLSLMKCIICEKQLDSTVYGCCDKHGHSICKPCYHGCLTFLSKSSIGCPFVFDHDHEQKQCKEAIIPLNLEKGMQEHWDNYLNRLNFQSPCPSVMYGCDFIGQSEIEMLTHSLSCNFRHLRECVKYQGNASAKKCAGVFDSISELLKHLNFKHNCMQGKNDHMIILLPFNYVPNPALRETDDKWYPLTRLPTSYANGRHCLVLIDENESSIRIWVTEVDATRDLTKEDSFFAVKAPVLGDYSCPSFTYEFTGKILPFMTLSFNDTDTTGIPYFEVPKNFLRHYAETNAVGKAVFRIFIRFRFPVKKASKINDGIGANRDTNQNQVTNFNVGDVLT